MPSAGLVPVLCSAVGDRDVVEVHPGVVGGIGAVEVDVEPQGDFLALERREVGGDVGPASVVVVEFEQCRQVGPVAVSYLMDRVVLPPAGTVTVCERVLSPSGSRPLVTPSRAEPAPLCALVAGLGAIAPPVVQDVRADSNPPVATMEVAGAVGVTGDEAVDAVDVPMALAAVTVNV